MYRYEMRNCRFLSLFFPPRLEGRRIGFRCFGSGTRIGKRRRRVRRIGFGLRRGSSHGDIGIRLEHSENRRGGRGKFLFDSEKESALTTFGLQITPKEALVRELKFALACSATTKPVRKKKSSSKSSQESAASSMQLDNFDREQYELAKK